MPLYELSNGSLQGIQATQVDDTLGGEDDEFAALEEEKSKNLNASRERILSRFRL